MKKLLGCLIVALCFGTTLFAFDLGIGTRGMIGGNVGNVDSSKDGVVSGFGAYFNLDLFSGFGIQTEINFVSNTITTGNKSITFNPCEIIDVPVMLWYNHHMNNFVVGGGLGTNFSLYPDNSNRSNDSKINLGFALGANVKYYFISSFGIVLGANAVFDFSPVDKVANPDGSTTITFDDTGSKRKAIYGSIGIEMNLF